MSREYRHGVYPVENMMCEKRSQIARRVADFFEAGNLVSLGVGLPTLVANYIPRDKNITLFSENGIISLLCEMESDRDGIDVPDAGCLPMSILPGGASLNSAESFELIMGGHLDIAVLGALEVDECGNFANWIVPGSLVLGMGAAMEIVACTKKVIIAMEHTTKDGTPKILKKCKLPLTAINAVNYIVTELGVMEVTVEGIILKELAPGVTRDEIQAKTEAMLIETGSVEQCPFP